MNFNSLDAVLNAQVGELPDPEPRRRRSSAKTRLIGIAPLDIGSQAEVAQRLQRQLQALNGQVIGAEGEFWYFDGKCWQSYKEHELRRMVLAFDGTPYGRDSVMRISDGFVTGTLRCLADIVEGPDFFAEPAIGICCESGFIEFENATPRLVPHNREQRHRFVLPGRWTPSEPPPIGPLFNTLLNGCFKDDEEAEQKKRCLRQLTGSITLGYATRLTSPKAFVLWGPGAENGKKAGV